MSTDTGMPEHPEERAMIAEILAGDRRAFHDLIRPYESVVFRIIRSMLPNEADAEDTVQEAFLNAFRNLDHFRGEARFSTWLIGIAMNEARMRLRRAKRFPMLSIDAAPTDPRELKMELADVRKSPSAEAEERELRFLLRRAVAELPMIYRHIYNLRVIHEYSFAETARRLGVTETTAKARYHRAKQRIRQSLSVFGGRGAVPRQGKSGDSVRGQDHDCL